MCLLNKKHRSCFKIFQILVLLLTKQLTKFIQKSTFTEREKKEIFQSIQMDIRKTVQREKSPAAYNDVHGQIKIEISVQI